MSTWPAYCPHGIGDASCTSREACAAKWRAEARARGCSHEPPCEKPEACGALSAKSASKPEDHSGEAPPDCGEPAVGGPCTRAKGHLSPTHWHIGEGFKVPPPCARRSCRHPEATHAASGCSLCPPDRRCLVFVEVHAPRPSEAHPNKDNCDAGTCTACLHRTRRAEPTANEAVSVPLGAPLRFSAPPGTFEEVEPRSNGARQAVRKRCAGCLLFDNEISGGQCWEYGASGHWMLDVDDRGVFVRPCPDPTAKPAEPMSLSDAIEEMLAQSIDDYDVCRICRGLDGGGKGHESNCAVVLLSAARDAQRTEPTSNEAVPVWECVPCNRQLVGDEHAGDWCSNGHPAQLLTKRPSEAYLEVLALLNKVASGAASPEYAAAELAWMSISSPRRQRTEPPVPCTECPSAGLPAHGRRDDVTKSCPVYLARRDERHLRSAVRYATLSAAAIMLETEGRRSAVNRDAIYAARGAQLLREMRDREEEPRERTVAACRDLVMFEAGVADAEARAEQRGESPAPMLDRLEEVREDGRVVRKDRWESGIRRIVTILFGNSYAFEVDEVVERVRALRKVAEAARAAASDFRLHFTDEEHALLEALADLDAAVSSSTEQSE